VPMSGTLANIDLVTDRIPSGVNLRG